jgi:hypothetical protein
MMSTCRWPALLLTGLLLAWGCAREAAQPARDATDERADVAAQETPARVDCVGLEISILATEPSRSALRARFGAPDSVISAVEPNRHVEGAVDSLFVVHYPGLLVSIRTPTGAADLADHVEITDARYIRHAQLAIGASEAQIAAVLGPPTRRTPEAMIYECGAGAEQPVTFRLQAGVVRSIMIDYYVD